MDSAKTMAKLVVAAGVISMWTGFGPASLVRRLTALARPVDAPVAVVDPVWTPAPRPSPADGPSWFDQAKPFCNAVEVEGYLRANPFPADFDGSAQGAACLALAAGPLMELVVDFWPNHSTALYHAGAARYQRDEPEIARKYLEEFLKNYDQDDGWTQGARTMLASMEVERS